MALARQGRIPPAAGVWPANVMFFLAGAWLLWRVDRMPMEIASLRGFWHAIKAHTQRLRGAFERALSRRRFRNTRFPQILDDYVLREFFLYLGLVCRDLPRAQPGLHLLRTARRHRAQPGSDRDVAEYLVNGARHVYLLMTR